MRWSNIYITIIKEIRGIFRDKRSMKTLIILPLIIPFYILLIGYMEDTMINDALDEVHTIGVNYNISNVEKMLLNQNGSFNVLIYKNADELYDAYKKGDIEAYIVKDENNYKIYASQSSTSSALISSNLYAFLSTYNQYLGNNYLVSQDIDTSLVFENINIEFADMKDIDEDEKDYMLIMLLSIVISYILIIISQSAITVSCDATAGEKERGTLETLLTFPIKSSEIITGKYLAITVFGMFFGLISLLLIIPSISLGKILFDSFGNIEFNFSFISILYAIIIIIIDSFLTAGICMALAGSTKTYKEAQAATQFVTVFSMLPMFSEFLELDSFYMNFIPLSNCGFALNNVLIDKLDVSSLIAMFVSSIVYIVIIIFVISKQYKSEKTLFS